MIKKNKYLFKSHLNNEKKEALNLVSHINNIKTKTLVIHYSCESLRQARTPRIGSICIKDRFKNETKSFSIHQIAEKYGYVEGRLTEKDYETCEKELLDNFFRFLSSKRDYIVIHWKMRNDLYGFEALINRYNLFYKNKKKLSWVNGITKYDLSEIIDRIQRQNRAVLQGERIINLAKLNELPFNYCLKGEDEAKNLTKGKYREVYLSTLQKIEIFDELIKLIDKQIVLIHNINNNLTPQILVKSYWIWIVSNIGTSTKNIFWSAIEPLIQSFFGTVK